MLQTNIKWYYYWYQSNSIILKLMDAIKISIFLFWNWFLLTVKGKAGIVLWSSLQIDLKNKRNILIMFKKEEDIYWIHLKLNIVYVIFFGGKNGLHCKNLFIIIKIIIYLE